MGGIFGTDTHELRLDDDDGHWIVLYGKQSYHCVPYYGITLDDGEEERLRKWLNGERE